MVVLVTSPVSALGVVTAVATGVWRATGATKGADRVAGEPSTGATWIKPRSPAWDNAGVLNSGVSTEGLDEVRDASSALVAHSFSPSEMSSVGSGAAFRIPSAS